MKTVLEIIRCQLLLTKPWNAIKTSGLRWGFVSENEFGIRFAEGLLQ